MADQREVDMADQRDDKLTDSSSSHKIPAIEPIDPMHIFADFSIGPPIGIAASKFPPVHEFLTVAAFNLAGDQSWLIAAPASRSYNDSQWELIRGLYWNDDPECELLNLSKSSNHDFGTGFDYGSHFLKAQHRATKPCAPNTRLYLPMLDRSQFWDMQFLHGMSADASDSRYDTQNQIVFWAEFMYRIATGDGSVDPNKALKDIPIQTQIYKSPGAPSPTTIHRFFTGTSSVRDSTTIKGLLTHWDPYTHLDISKRALGSLLHMVEDSYARGHVHRKDDSRIGPGTNNGAVVEFYCYRGQDSNWHEQFDKMPLDNVNVHDPKTYDFWPGARQAVEVCARVIKMVQSKQAWENGVSDYFVNQVWNLA